MEGQRPVGRIPHTKHLCNPVPLPESQKYSESPNIPEAITPPPPISFSRKGKKPMNDRFNSSGSFTVSIPAPSTPATVPAASPVAPVASPELAHPFALDGTGKGKKPKSSSKESTKSRVDKDFEGNRFGVSPMALGLMLGVGLIAFGITQCKREDLPQFGSSGGEIREYKRYIRHTDLPGR